MMATSALLVLAGGGCTEAVVGPQWRGGDVRQDLRTLVRQSLFFAPADSSDVDVVLWVDARTRDDHGRWLRMEASTAGIDEEGWMWQPAAVPDISTAMSQAQRPEPVFRWQTSPSDGTVRWVAGADTVWMTAPAPAWADVGDTVVRTWSRSAGLPIDLLPAGTDSALVTVQLYDLGAARSWSIADTTLLVADDGKLVVPHFDVETTGQPVLVIGVHRERYRRITLRDGRRCGLVEVSYSSAAYRIDP